MSDPRLWSTSRSTKAVLVAHLPLAFAVPAFLALTWHRGRFGCEVLFCGATKPEIFTVSAMFWTPVMLAIGVALSSLLNLLLHRRMRFEAWREVGVACVVTYGVLLLAFLLVADPFHLIGQDNVAFG